MSNFVLFFLYAGLMAFGQLLFKQAANQLKELPPSSGFTSVMYLIGNSRFMTACVVYAVATVLWVAVLAQFNLSVAYPIVISLSVLLTVLIGVFIFDEPFTAYGFLGLCSVIIGIIILAKNGQ